VLSGHVCSSATAINASKESLPVAVKEQTNGQYKEFLNLWISTPHECTRNWAAYPKIECYLTINLTLPPILMNGAYAHGGCQVNGPKVAKFLDR